ncbi:PucR family transcriptional regulator [Bacillus benzoevorans]|uniref:Purine catabolism regulator n=1 Tax=Bacillus benzoevorans TaxID=1456 RepID=A0A7X0HUC7_9BACI|nr:PucR family transcriptional regulator [Bacillus benzoevorans]MBB6445731.1 purine catabolism regulator [Bacillus benzoevorans]
MGVCVKDMLKSEAFTNYKLLAGHGGVDNQIQGLAVMDAPDGFGWYQGRELLITSGYVFYKNPGLFEKLIESGDLKRISALGIKLGRYINRMPDHIVKFFNENNIPLISIPFEHSWMDIMNRLNVLVMNTSIRQFNIRNINPLNYSNLSYQVRKIDNILSQIEKEMNFPAMLYDLANEKAYYSSPAFLKLADKLELEDFWQPSFDFAKEILCNNLNMVRYRFFDEKYDKPYSWITVPITVGDKIEAYFVVVEATGLIDYFDQFALRIGFVLLQSLYEQMLMAQNIGDAGFEKFVTDYLLGNLSNHEMIEKRAAEINIDINLKYCLVLMKQTNKDIYLSSYRDIVKNAVYTNICYPGIRMAMIDENRFIFLIPTDESISHEKNLKLIKGYFKELNNRLEKKVNHISLLFGISDISDSIYGMKRNYLRCEKTLSNGKLLFPNKNYLVYSDLGVFAWMDIQEDEIEMMLKDLKELFADGENKELIETLKVYLDCKMNYTHTAKKLYIHINTVRKRIDHINDIIQLDLEDPLNRLKLEILLKLFN